MIYLRRVPLIFIFITLYLVNYGAIKLSALTGDNMVLQQKSKVALWGWSDPGEKVFITTSWNNTTTAVTADADGKWITSVNKPVAVRFAWKNVPTPNLYNKACLPASPFRTDNRILSTQGKN